MAIYFEYPEVFKANKELHELLGLLSGEYLEELNKLNRQKDRNFRVIRNKSELVRWLVVESLNSNLIPKEIRDKIMSEADYA